MNTTTLPQNASRSLRLTHVCLLAALSAPVGFAHAATYLSDIQLLNLDGSLTAGSFAASATPLTRTLTSTGNSALTGSTSSDLGVLKAAAAVPTWTGAQGGSYTYYQALSTASYIDVLTFTRPGGGKIDVSFSFAFDGRVIDPAPAQSERAALTLGLTLSGAANSITTTSTRDYYFRDGARNTRYDNYFQFSPCRAGQFGQSPLICQQKNSFSYSTSGDKVGTATFTFSVLSGQAVKVQADIEAFVYSDPYLSAAASYDFFHTATLSAIGTPAGTDVYSEAVGQLVSTNGGVTYAPALAAAVPEPQSIMLMLAGLGLVCAWARRSQAA